MSDSKPLGISDSGGFEFSKEMLAGDNTYGINFDRVQWDNESNCYVIVEYLNCDESQFSKGITPFTSHPNKYFFRNALKFISLWDLNRKLGGKLYLVNYSKKGTKFEDEVLLMEVLSVDPKDSSPVKTKDTKQTRASFSKWFRELNSRGAHKFG